VLTQTRSSFQPVFLFAFCLVVAVTTQGQGLPPSVTSIGFGGFSDEPRGIAPSVTSLGRSSLAPVPSFWGNCCGNFFAPSGHWHSGPMPPLRPEWRRHHRDDLTYLPMAVPVYIPYGVPYAADMDEEGGDDSDSDSYAYVANFGPLKHGTSAKRPRPRIVEKDSDEDAAPKVADPEQPEEPVAPQPATVLVFKDGHRSFVANYAIVGNTLFDFAEGRSRKILLADLDLAATERANDERGVDFRVPPASSK
jgi:hypothetical protein